MLSRRDFLLATSTSACVGLTTLAMGDSHAQSASWPYRPLRLVIPYPPGGATDITARIYGNRMRSALNQSVVMENKAGAGGEIGAELVARSAPDGYTFLFGAIGSLAIHAVIPSQRPPYSLADDLMGVSMGSGVSLALAVRNDLPARTVPALLELARAKPGGLTYGTPGNGSTQHMSTEYFKQRAGVDMVHVAYKGSGPAITALMGGQIDLVFETLPALTPQLNSGKLRILGVASLKRSPLLPDVATLDELGVTGFEVTTLYGLLAPRGTPAAVVGKMSSVMQSIAALPEVQAAFTRQGATAVTSDPAETDSMIQREVAKWAEVAKLAKIT